MTTTRSGRRQTLSVLVGLVAGTVLVTGVAASTAASGGVDVRDAAVGATELDTAAVYMELDSADPEPLTLVGASCNCGAEVTVHATDTSGGRSQMVATPGITVDPGAATVLSPGGSHLMLEGLTAPLVDGDRLALDLEFDRGDPVRVEVPVLAPQELTDRIPIDDGGTS